MDTVKIHWWHHLFAHELVWWLEQQRCFLARNKDEIEILRDQLEQLKKSDYIHPCILTVRDHAAKQRIRDLEKEVTFLRKELREKN